MFYQKYTRWRCEIAYQILTIDRVIPQHSDSADATKCCDNLSSQTTIFRILILNIVRDGLEMREISFEQLLEAARTLAPEQRRVLTHMLQLGVTVPPEDSTFVEADVLNEAGAYSVFTPLAEPSAAPEAISDAELIAASQCISCEWEEDPL